jgi:hypothetical protein
MAFESATVQERQGLCTELAERISKAVQGATPFHDAVQEVVSALREVGHDLWSFDEEDEFEVWGPDYSPPASPGVIITFRRDETSEAVWTDFGRSH